MDEYEGFSPTDAEIVCSVYVCAVCEGGLIYVENFIAQDGTRIVICPEHGNVESIGRITKTTVAIRNERSVFEFPRAIRALPEFWGELIPTKQDRERMIKELGF